jgi:putative nucleotidyltransferase with HDIG domain
MAIDPVCRMIIEDKDAAATSLYKGAAYYFCSLGCKERFIKAPERFTSSKQKSKIYCTHCQTEILDELYIKKDSSYCCEKCYFRDKFLGDVLDKIEGVYLATIEAFVEAIDAREHEVGNHSYRVTQFAMVLAKKIGVSGRDLVDIYCGSLLHDLGKIGIPDTILLKEEALSEEEHRVMSRHPEIGCRIISHIGYLSKAAEIIYSHHERYDGSGYPKGLKKDEIPFGARIFAVCDALDALTVDRPYRRAVPFEKAKEEILSASGAFLDPNVIEGFLNAEEDIKEFVSKIVF